MSRSRHSGHTPTAGLLIELAVTVLAVAAYSYFTTAQISGLRKLQNDLSGRNRKDSLQLLRIQGDLNSLGLAMRDMLDNDERYPLRAWAAQFQRIRADLDNALLLEEQLAVAERTPEQSEFLRSSLTQFWDAVDHTFALAREGRENDALGGNGV